MKRFTQFLAFGVGITLFIAFIVFLEVDLALLLVGDLSFLLIGLLFFLTIVPVASLRTHYLLRTTGADTPRNLLSIEFASRFLYAVSPFRLNIPGKAVLLSRYTKISKTQGVSLTSFEFILDFFLVLIVLLAALLFFPTIWGANTEWVAGIIFGVIVLAISFFFWAPIPLIVKRILQWVEKMAPHPLIGKGIQRVQLFGKGIIDLSHSPFALMIGTLTLVIWLGSTVSLYFILQSYSVSVSLYWLLAANAIGLLAGAISQLPGGIGIKEASMVFFLGSLGVPLAVLSVSLVWSRLFTLVPSGIGYIVLVRYLQSNPSKKASPNDG